MIDNAVAIAILLLLAILAVVVWWFASGAEMVATSREERQALLELRERYRGKQAPWWSIE
jgi:uncharacterized membrane protein YqiK